MVVAFGHWRVQLWGRLIGGAKNQALRVHRWQWGPIKQAGRLARALGGQALQRLAE